MLSARPISLNADVDVYQQPILNTKTPGRKGLKGRSALQENALHNGAKTVLTKKNVLQTPFRPGTAHGKKQHIAVSVTRPLMDKTPFPNRVGPSNFGNAGKTPGLKLSKLALLAPEPEQESGSPDVAPLLRPSTARKSLRGRLSQNFKTPLTKGNYWDVSPEDMEGIGGGVVEQTQQQAVAVEADEDDEIEYMPPTAIERPYEPPFAMPDYQTMGSNLFQLGHSGLVDDTADVFYAADIEEQVDVKTLLAESGFSCQGPSRGDTLELPPLEDDHPFGRQTPASKLASAPPPARSAVPLARASSARTAPMRTQPPPRPATAIPQSRLPTSARASPGTVLAVAPGQTRTSALRAAKAASSSTSNSATTPNPVPVRATTSAGARPAPTARKASPAATIGTRPPARAATSLAVGPSRSSASSTPAVAVGRARSATVTGRTAPKPAAKSKTPDDPLAAMFDRERDDGGDDFRFDV